MLYIEFGPWVWVSSRTNNTLAALYAAPARRLLKKQQKSCFGRAAAACCWEVGNFRWRTVCTGSGGLRCPCTGLHRSERSAQGAVIHLRTLFESMPYGCRDVYRMAICAATAYAIVRIEATKRLRFSV